MKNLKAYQLMSENGLFIISYKNNLGDDKTISVEKSIITNEDITSKVEAYLESLPNEKDRVKNIEMKNGYFTIIGEKLSPKLKVINELSNDDLSKFTAFDNFILEYTGLRINALSSVLNTNCVKINDIIYNQDSNPSYNDLVTASNGTLLTATLMAINLFK